jgi:hypothetical protein
MDSWGNFVVAWTHYYTASDRDVYAARFDLSGKRLGSPIKVADYVKSEYNPAVGMASNGDFVVAYTYQFSTSDTDIHAKMYRWSGPARSSRRSTWRSAPRRRGRAASPGRRTGGSRSPT